MLKAAQSEKRVAARSDNGRPLRGRSVPDTIFKGRRAPLWLWLVFPSGANREAFIFKKGWDKPLKRKSAPQVLLCVPARSWDAIESVSIDCATILIYIIRIMFLCSLPHIGCHRIGPISMVILMVFTDIVGASATENIVSYSLMN